MDARIYLPSVAWSFKVRNVILLTRETTETPATYRATAIPFDSSEPGANQTAKEVGYYITDNIGNIYPVIGTGINTVDLSDDFRWGVGPQTGKWAVLSKSVGNSIFLTPIHYRRLDKSAIDNIRRIELAVLWKGIYSPSVKFIVDGLVFSFDPADPDNVTYTDGSFTILNFNPKTEVEIESTGRDNYHPERTWTISGATVTAGAKVFAKVPINETTTGELVIADELTYEGYYDGYLNIPIGTIGALVDGKRDISMLWGNVKGGSGGVSSHADLTPETLVWPESAHTGNEADRVAGFGESREAVEYEMQTLTGLTATVPAGSSIVFVNGIAQSYT